MWFELAITQKGVPAVGSGDAGVLFNRALFDKFVANKPAGYMIPVTYGHPPDIETTESWLDVQTPDGKTDPGAAAWVKDLMVIPCPWPGMDGEFSLFGNLVDFTWEGKDAILDNKYKAFSIGWDRNNVIHHVALEGAYKPAVDFPVTPIETTSGGRPFKTTSFQAKDGSTLTCASGAEIKPDLRTLTGADPKPAHVDDQTAAASSTGTTQKSETDEAANPKGDKGRTAKNGGNKLTLKERLKGALATIIEWATSTQAEVDGMADEGAPPAAEGAAAAAAAISAGVAAGVQAGLEAPAGDVAAVQSALDKLNATLASAKKTTADAVREAALAKATAEAEVMATQGILAPSLKAAYVQFRAGDDKICLNPESPEPERKYATQAEFCVILASQGKHLPSPTTKVITGTSTPPAAPEAAKPPSASARAIMGRLGVSDEQYQKAAADIAAEKAAAAGEEDIEVV